MSDFTPSVRTLVFAPAVLPWKGRCDSVGGAKTAIATRTKKRGRWAGQGV